MKKNINDTKHTLLVILFLFVLLLVSISLNIYYSTIITSLKTSLLKSQKNDELAITALALPTVTPVVKNSIDSNFQTTIIETPKYLDDPTEKETYEVTFEKVSSESVFTVTQEKFQHLVISDPVYEFSVYFPKEGSGQVFQETPLTQKISTDQFGTLHKVFKSAGTVLSYTSDYSEDCSQHSPQPAACSSMLIEFPNPLSEFNKTYVSASCKADTSKAIEFCDKIISSLKVRQL